MEAWMAFVSIMAIIAIVVVAGGLIAFITHMILGVFDNNKQSVKKEEKGVIDYSQFKQLENGYSKAVEDSQEYDFDAITKSKAEKEKAMLENDAETIFDLEEDKDEELEEIENRLKEEAVEEVAEDDDLDNFTIDDMLSEISNDIIEEEKAQQEETEVTMSDELAYYSIDDLLNETEIEEETEVEEVAEEIAETEAEEIEEVVEELPSEPVILSVDNKKDEEIEALKAQLAELNQQLELAKNSKTEEVVKIDMTEEECVARLETLEERLKAVKKDYKINSKEYRPLKKVMNDLEKYQTKLRRKETVVAKKKVSLYGVNNYVDIDKEKAEKLANELELLDGLRLSVSHCEEVINANKDRFPILEHTNQILEDQIAHLEADIASTQATLNKIREQNGEGSNGEGTNE